MAKNPMVSLGVDYKTFVPRMQMEDYMSDFVGQKIANIAARYQYRGTLSLVGSRFVVLADSCAVEQSGSSRNAEPQTEDRIPSDLMISLDAIEIFYQPTWVQAKLPD